MPDKRPRYCLVRTCSKLLTDGRKYCDEHVGAHTGSYEAARLSAHQRGYGRRWAKIRNAFLAEYPACDMCGAPATDVHHRIRRAISGSDEFNNLQALCHSCHSKITATERMINE